MQMCPSDRERRGTTLHRSHPVRHVCRVRNAICESPYRRNLISNPRLLTLRRVKNYTASSRLDGNSGSSVYSSFELFPSNYSPLNRGENRPQVLRHIRDGIILLETLCFNFILTIPRGIDRSNSILWYTILLSCTLQRSRIEEEKVVEKSWIPPYPAFSREFSCAIYSPRFVFPRGNGRGTLKK